MANKSKKGGKKLPRRAGKKAKRGYHLQYLTNRRRRRKPPGWTKPKKVVTQRCEICGYPSAEKPNAAGKIFCSRAKRGLERVKRTS